LGKYFREIFKKKYESNIHEMHVFLKNMSDYIICFPISSSDSSVALCDGINDNSIELKKTGYSFLCVVVACLAWDSIIVPELFL